MNIKPELEDYLVTRNEYELEELRKDSWALTALAEKYSESESQLDEWIYLLIQLLEDDTVHISSISQLKEAFRTVLDIRYRAGYAKVATVDHDLDQRGVSDVAT